MQNYPDAASPISLAFTPVIKFSILTLVSKPLEYVAMVQSCVTAGFNTEDCEFLYIDNSERNVTDAYAGLNRLITEAKGKYLILCHQDILLKYDNRAKLEQRIAELDILDNNWAILSNAGAADLKRVVYKLTVADEEFQKKGVLPCKVRSVDEHFMVMKKEANLGLSTNLKGFHLYGTDLCLQAAFRGYTAWIVDFHLYHASKGKVDATFYNVRTQLINKYGNALRSQAIRTTITSFFLSGSIVLATIGNTKAYLWMAKQITKLYLGLNNKK